MTRPTHPTIREITAESVDYLATGTGILGSGGGGQPRVGRLRLESLFEDESYPDNVTVVPPESLSGDDTVTSVGQIGSPMVGSEKLPKGDEEIRALNTLEEVSDSSVDALLPGEIGGANSFAPLIAGLQLDLPVVDADAMGRALPELQMDTLFIHGQEVNYAVLTDEKDNEVIYKNIDSATRFEKLARSATVGLGGSVGYAYPILDGKFVSSNSVNHTLSLSHELGKTVHDARESNVDPIAAICDLTDGHRLFAGQVTEVERRNENGFIEGQIEISDVQSEETVRLQFQNEFLKATRGSEVIATVPDLISVLDRESGEAILAEDVQFGQRVVVVGIPAPKLLTTDKALDVVGPRAFGYDLHYVPLAEGAD